MENGWGKGTVGGALFWQKLRQELGMNILYLKSAIHRSNHIKTTDKDKMKK